MYPCHFSKEEKAKAYKKEKQKEKKRKAEEDLFEEDDEMAAVMGFSGFGSSKKGKWPKDFTHFFTLYNLSLLADQSKLCCL